MLSLLPALLVASAVLPPAPQAEARSERPVEDEPEWIYYDYLEDGVLKGGKVRVDPENPLHAEVGGVQYASTSSSTTLVDNGPVENRIDLVFVGDGYTAAEMAGYATDVGAIWPAVLAEPPLDTYATYFNVHRVDVVSNESGVDNDPSQGIQRDTALDMAYWCGGTARLLCVNVSKARAEADNAPDRDQILAVANSSTYGGAGYSDLATLAGGNTSTIEVALHELGHSFPGLADEYDYGGPANWPGGEPTEKNVSIYDETQMASQETKWHLWLDLPNVSTFEGAKYSQFGIYRPTSNSKMRSLGRPFEEFNSARFVREIYRYVDPIDGATEPGIHPLDHVFFVDPMDPVGHALDVQWKLEGMDIPGANGLAFDAATLGLPPGFYRLSVEVVDNTSLVRSEVIRDKFLTSTRTWWLAPHRKARRR